MRSITLNNINEVKKSLQGIVELVKSTPNDMILGEQIRKLSDEIYEKLK
jgi:hypothetical protein